MDADEKKIHPKTWKRRAVKDVQQRLRCMKYSRLQNVNLNVSNSNNSSSSSIYEEGDSSSGRDEEEQPDIADGDGHVNLPNFGGDFADCVGDGQESMSDVASTVDDNESDHNSDDVSDHDSDPGGAINFQDERQKDAYVLQALKDWGLSGVSFKKVDELLYRLRPVFPCLPKSYKTLLNTPSTVPVRDFPNGQFWYQGIKVCLDAIMTEEYLEKMGEVLIDINMDGLPLCKSKKTKFWPILGLLVSGVEHNIFVIACFCGEEEPGDLELYFENFVLEARHLIQEGYIFNDVTYKFGIRHYILDAPARSLMKCCIGHTGYSACEKCCVRGEWHDHRMTFCDVDCALRSDESFQMRSDPQHHSAVRSPLEHLNTGMVSQFRLDYMHLVCQGVFRRLVMVWLTVVGPWKLHVGAVDGISEELLRLVDHCPSEFSRKPRSLKEWKMYKATEWRRLLLYDGLIAFKNHVDENVYKHFLLLHCGISILASNDLLQEKSEVAEMCLKTFIKHSVSIYGKWFVSYNVHSLVHLTQECQEHGVLDSFSAFPFENQLKSIKSVLRSCYKPLQQLARREIEGRSSKKVCCQSQDLKLQFSKKINEQLELIDGDQFQKMHVNDVVFSSVGNRDVCFRTKQEDIIVIKHLLRSRANTAIIIAQKFKEKSDFYMYPLPSSDLGIFKVSVLDNVKTIFELNDIAGKCVLLPLSGSHFVCVPLLHHSHPFLY